MYLCNICAAGFFGSLQKSFHCGEKEISQTAKEKHEIFVSIVYKAIAFYSLFAFFLAHEKY